MEKNQTIKCIEKEFDITRSTASKNVDLLVENGYILREPVDYDARLKKLVLTEKSLSLSKFALTSPVPVVTDIFAASHLSRVTSPVVLFTESVPVAITLDRVTSPVFPSVVSEPQERAESLAFPVVTSIPTLPATAEEITLTLPVERERRSDPADIPSTSMLPVMVLVRVNGRR